MQNHLKVQDGIVELDNICLVAGLGPEDNRRRDGSYEYYVSEPVVSNDAKGTAPFVLCYTEIRRLNSQ
jgi:unsaturated rhamnogalacturonyl hydrolase